MRAFLHLYAKIFFFLSSCIITNGLQFQSQLYRLKPNAGLVHSQMATSYRLKPVFAVDENEKPDIKTFFLGNEGEFVGDVKKIKLDVPRFVAYNLLAVALAFGSNFLGITNVAMTSTNPEYFRAAKFDQLYSIGGYRRHVDTEDRYQYIFPEAWLYDRALLLADARERDMPKMIRDKQKISVRPDSAYGPKNDKNQPGDFKENISIIKSNVMPGFTLKGTLGPPIEAAERLLQNMAQPGSNKKFSLLSATSEMRGKAPAYVFEYTIKKEDTTNDKGQLKKGFYQHSISVVMSRGTELFTLTGVAPESVWETEKSTIETIAKSFELESPTLPEGFY